MAFLSLRHRFAWTPIAGTAFVVLVCSCLLLLGLKREHGLRDADLREAAQEAANLARSLIRHAEDTTELVDSALSQIVHQLQTDGFSSDSLRRVEDILQVKIATTPRLRALTVYRADGSRADAAEIRGVARLNIFDRDYFQYHLHSTSKEVLIGAPVRSRITGEWVITLTRRISDRTGGFAGVAAASVEISYFQNFYSQFLVGPRGSIALVHGNGTILARAPFRDDYIGRNLSSSPRLRESQSQQTGLIHYFSALDGVERISAFHRSLRFPLVVLVARSKDDVLAAWSAGAGYRIGVVAVLVLFVALLGGLLVMRISAHQRALRIVRSREADFRLLAEASRDMVTRINFDGMLTYVSPAAAHIVGWSPEQLLGTHSLAGVHPEDRPEVDELVSKMQRGELNEARVAYRTRHRLRGTVWLESVMTVTHQGAADAIDGVVAVSRDITTQKQVESGLAELAQRDGLTGLYNRRHFDAQLAAERERAARNAAPLSLLVIDVDHFKNFNDSYGHTAGDACLRQIAAALGAVAARPRDLAARFGGEEFVLLLPDTDNDGCRSVGERILQAVVDLAIEHRASSVFHHVTVSVGGATILAHDGDTTTQVLIESADQALYAAKAAGRNRVKISATTRKLFQKSAQRNGA